MSQPHIIADRYEVIQLLGEGGFAHVYKALDTEMGRTVAIKILKLELLGHANMRETFMDRFAREVSVTASLEHPHIVPVYDTGMTSDEHGTERPFLVMKLLEGQDLETVLEQSGPLSVKTVLAIGKQALDALAYVHEQGVVHKDLKPANLFLAYDRRGEPHVYIMDFGIAHDPRGGAERMTQTGAFTGTLQYLAPEYLLDQLAEPSVDVYQMGLILVELLSNRPVVPFETTMPELIAKYIRREPIVLPGSFEGTPSGELFARATVFDHHKRYQNAGQLLEAWEALGRDDFPDDVGEFSPHDTISAASISSPLLHSSDEFVFAPTMPESSVTGSLSRASSSPSFVGHVVANSSTHSLSKVGLIVMLLVMMSIGAVVLLSMKSDQTLEVDPGPSEVVAQGPVASGSALLVPGADLLPRSLTTEPVGASVFVDGELVGVAPLEVNAIRAFDLRVEKDGYQTFSGTYEAGMNDPLRVVLDPTPVPASGREQAEPEASSDKPVASERRARPARKSVRVNKKKPEVKAPQPSELPTTTLPPEF